MDEFPEKPEFWFFDGTAKLALKKGPEAETSLNKVNFILTDINGRLIKKWFEPFIQKNQSHTLDIPSALENGFFILNIQSAEGNFTEKLIHQN